MPLQRQGIALIAALVFAFIIFILVSIGTVSSYSNRENAVAAVNTTQTQLAAEAGLDRAVNEVWHLVWAQSPNIPKNLDNYKYLLQQKNIPATYDTTLTGNLGNGTTFSVKIQRVDEEDPRLGGGRTVAFALESTGSNGTSDQSATRKLTQTLQIGSNFPDNYALLTRSVSCTFCHADFQSIDALKGAATNTQPWKPTTVGVMEVMQTRSDTDSIIHGKVISRGQTANWNLADGIVSSGAITNTLTTTQVAGESQITGNTSRPINSEVTNCSTPSNCIANQVFYTNYPTQKPTGGWPAGELPTEFPKPIPDTNRNNLVDQSEWDDFINNIADKGTLQGNLKSFNSAGPLSWGGTSVTTISSGVWNGNLLLDGTSQATTINDTVYVNGDVIIRGSIKGKGRIVAKGNVYVMGSTTYQCGNRACSDVEYAENNPNEFSLVAGGNIILGDHSHPGWDPNRVTTDTAVTLSDCANYPSRTTARGVRCSEGMSFTDRQIPDFNRIELIKYFESGGTYRPRFYTRNGDESQAFFPATEGESGEWNDFAPLEVGNVVNLGRPVGGAPCQVGFPGCRVTVTAAMLSGELAAAINPGRLLPLSSGAPMEIGLRQLWEQSLADGHVNRSGEGLRFDGLMYSANSIFAIMSRRINRTPAEGRGLIDIRGAILAADTGVLAPGNGGQGLKIYHDYRLRPDISSTKVEINLRRSIQQLVKR